MAKYRRNIDEDIREAERQWMEHQDRPSGLAYANQLLRAGQLELTAFPFEIIQEMFPSGVPDSPTLYGATVGDIRDNLSTRVNAMMRSPNVAEDLASLARNFDPMYATTTLIWFPESHDLSLRYNWKQFDRDSVRLRDGEIEEESLTNIYRSLQVDFTLPEHESGNAPFSNFHYVVTSDSLIEYFGYYDEQRGRIEKFLVLNDGIPGDWNAAPSVSSGRCEDAPCCGHDICPPREAGSGVQLAMVCTCGRLVPRNAGSSLCGGCLSGVRHEAYYGEDFEPYTGDDEEDIDEDDEDDENEEDDDGSNSPFAPYEDEYLDSYEE